MRIRIPSPRKPAGDDRGASMVEIALLMTLAVIVIGVIATSPLSSQFNDGIREAVCRVEGPECNGETWVEHERPEEPEEYVWTFSGVPWDGEVSGSGNARVALEFALNQVGERYILGATGPDVWDCSSMVQAAWRTAGVQIPRTTWPQQGALPPVPRSDLQPGDLLFFHTIQSQPPPSHVAMYMGDGMMVHAANSRRGVVIDQFAGNSYYEGVFVGAGRPPHSGDA
ncbi:C40 family peptidase [Nocardiopsis suaedae]|uniref:C40 family peptidase n=1 Tax=Nocardiopsis suaedae TaxID=3018444 RepID=A0ABT4TRG4_9ACTN|nr:C40 family peptidase [Nocardiopsis suaedae]MDA2807278.1 C40 family peptidase [Nocardiopsis suaedae]